VNILFHLLSLRFLFYRFLTYFQLFLFSESAIRFLLSAISHRLRTSYY
jgi:hypothetical protein